MGVWVTFVGNGFISILYVGIKMKHSPPKQPLPWKCHRCREQEVRLATIEYIATARHDGCLHTFTIDNLKLPICQACGERVFTGDVDDQINDALRKHLNLLTPAQIRDGFKHLDVKDIKEQLGIGEATLSSWFLEAQIQSRVMDDLLRAFFAGTLEMKHDPQLIHDMNLARDGANVHTVNKALCYYEHCSLKPVTFFELQGLMYQALVTEDWSALRTRMQRWF